MNFHRVQTEFLERTGQTHLVGRDGDVGSLESCHDFNCTHAAVQMAFFVGVGFDGDRLLSDLVRQGWRPLRR